LPFLPSLRRCARPLLLGWFLFLFLFTGVVNAQDTQEGQPARPDQDFAEPASEVQTKEQMAGIHAQLNKIAQSIQERQKHLSTLRSQAASTDSSSEREALEAEIAELENLISASRDTFESLATGGLDRDIFSDQPAEEFNWQQDLFELIRPFIDQLQQLTEGPRRIDELKTQIAENQKRLVLTQRALDNISRFIANVENEELRQRLLALQSSWQQRQADLELLQDVARQRLQDAQAEQDGIWAMVQQGLLSFVKGRGLILLLAILATGGVWFVLQTLPKVIRGRRSTTTRRPRSRLMTIGYQAFCLAMAMITLLLVLYVSGDWLLLGLALVLVFMLLIGSKNYLPRFMSEVRMLLDMGPVREGERIIHDGIPWQVTSLNMYSTLVNPDLQGGVLRIPLGELTTKISRPVVEDEPWFPTRKDDFVMLSDGTFGQVLLQTPEVVQLKQVGSIRTYATASFLGNTPRNLSRHGFGIAVTFGIDYQHQSICLDQVPAVFDAAVTEAFQASSLADGLESVFVDFKEAGASSLDYLIYVMMRGQAAGSYWSVGRIVQQACVRVCNEHGWVIPFSQLTVHQGDGFEALREVRN